MALIRYLANQHVITAHVTVPVLLAPNHEIQGRIFTF
jgi:hypothetical protein